MPLLLRTMHDKPGSVFRANRGQQEVTLLAADMHDLCAVTGYENMNYKYGKILPYRNEYVYNKCSY